MNAASPATPLVVGFTLLLGLSFFLGLAFEDVFSRAGKKRPGGIRTFPMLALIGGLLYLFDPTQWVPFTAGLVVLGAWLLIYFQRRIKEQDEEGKPDVGLMVPLLNVYAYVLGAVALALPHWVAIGATVATVLFFTARTALHDLARRVEISEIVTAGQFLILTGLVLPLLPDTPVTRFTTISPHQAWLALLVVSTMSYGSYLAQRYLKIPAAGLWTAAVSGLYSSTATTVVLARQIKAEPGRSHQALAGITLATAIMYLRILVVVAVFNLALALRLAPTLLALAAAGFVITAIQFFVRRDTGEAKPLAPTGNPLELGAAALFAVLFVATSLGAALVTRRFGVTGVYSLAAVIGVADIDPFVLNLAQGGASGLTIRALAGAILIAAASNNLMKAAYAVIFAGWRQTLPSAAALVGLAAASVAVALLGVGL
jgi:uncharacterized membrane protein (DUF4010 family)